MNKLKCKILQTEKAIVRDVQFLFLSCFKVDKTSTRTEKIQDRGKPSPFIELIYEVHVDWTASRFIYILMTRLHLLLAALLIQKDAGDYWWGHTPRQQYKARDCTPIVTANEPMSPAAPKVNLKLSNRVEL